jgi:hypothetical protein
MDGHFGVRMKIAAGPSLELVRADLTGGILRSATDQTWRVA